MTWIRSCRATCFVLVAILGLACGKVDVTEDALLSATNTVSEAHSGGTVNWQIGSDGAIHALLKSEAGQPIARGVTGQVTWRTAGSEQTVPLTLDEKSGVLRGTGPKLEADLNEMRYTILVNHQPWSGTLFVPKGGTHQLNEDTARAQRNVSDAAVAGPHGGVIQVVGSDSVEIVGDKGSGQIRAYVFDANLKPVLVGARKLTLAVVVPNGSEVVQMSPAPEDAYFVGRLTARVDPVKITVAMTFGAKTDVVLVGWHPGRVVRVGQVAHPIHVWVDPHWDDHDDHDDHHHHHDAQKIELKIRDHHGRGHGRVKIKIH